jgi:hypothetical protein
MIDDDWWPRGLISMMIAFRWLHFLDDWWWFMAAWWHFLFNAFILLDFYYLDDTALFHLIYFIFFIYVYTLFISTCLLDRHFFIYLFNDISHDLLCSIDDAIYDAFYLIMHFFYLLDDGWWFDEMIFDYNLWWRWLLMMHFI